MDSHRHGRLIGTRCVITGASRGIGRAIALAQAEEGAHVALVARDRAALDSVAAVIADNGGQASVHAIDITEPQSVERLVAEVAESGDGVNVLINNAGMYSSGFFAELGDEDWRAIFELNLLGTVRVTRAFLPGMVSAGCGRIINVASTAGKAGTAGQSAYNASKHALLGLTRSLALEVAGDGVRVTAICPGWVDTDLIDEVAMAPRLGVRPDEVRATLAARAPIGRMTSPEEVAALAVYLSSPEADAVTGVGFTIAGGMLAI